MSHDFNGKSELFSYRAKASEELRQAEALEKKAYGQLAAKVKSPSTIFMCLWRNPSRRKLADDRPAEIFLSCSFAPTPVENPRSLVEMAEIYNSIDRANLKAMWEYRNGNYRLSRFNVEIQADRKSYRSINQAADIPQIQVVQNEMTFPQNVEDPFRFNLRSQLPSRRKPGDIQRDTIVSVNFSGMAEPMPDWVNY
ncbi:MAG: hypothetical protein AAF299_05250 [Pseudomonadota bacterium]